MDDTQQTPHDQWCLGSRSGSCPYQLSGIASSFRRLEEVPEYTVWSACTISDRQHDSGLFSEKCRRDKVQDSRPFDSRSDILV